MQWIWQSNRLIKGLRWRGIAIIGRESEWVQIWLGYHILGSSLHIIGSWWWIG